MSLTNAMLVTYGLENRIPEAKEWYNGYLFGDKEIYNPWSVISYGICFCKKSCVIERYQG